MDGRIDPPSSMHRLRLEDVARQAREGEVWVIEDSFLVACVFLTPRSQVLYLGKLAVASSHRGRGLARRLVAQAAHRARALGLATVELETRIELRENHAAFARLGFVKTAETAHPGYTRPTSMTMQLKVE